MKRITVRLEDTTYNLLVEKMKAVQINSISQFIRESIIKKKLVQKNCKGIEVVITELNRIGNNLNQISRYVNKEKQIDNEVSQLISDIYDELHLLIEAYQ